MKRLPPIVLLAIPLLGAECSLGPERDLGQIFPGKESLRAVVIGDFGDPGNKAIQEGVASAIAARHLLAPFDIGLTVGDNFYPKGVKTINDTKYWVDIFEQDYGLKLKIPFFPTLGNHDYRGNEKAQMDYPGKYIGDCKPTDPNCRKTWNLPCNYYTYAAGPVRFFALDTDEGTSEGPLGLDFGAEWSSAPIAWLETQLARHAAAPWKVVYAHHPAFTDGNHHKQKRVRQVREKLVPVLEKHGVHAYVAGHDHDLQYRKVGNIHYPVIGGGGKNIKRSRAKAEAEFYELSYGFMILEVSEGKMKLEIVGGKPPDPFTTKFQK